MHPIRGRSTETPIAQRAVRMTGTRSSSVDHRVTHGSTGDGASGADAVERLGKEPPRLRQVVQNVCAWRYSQHAATERRVQPSRTTRMPGHENISEPTTPARCSTSKKPAPVQSPAPGEARPGVLRNHDADRGRYREETVWRESPGDAGQSSWDRQGHPARQRMLEQGLQHGLSEFQAPGGEDDHLQKEPAVAPPVNLRRTVAPLAIADR